MIKKGDKRAQFYFVATIVIIGLVAGIALTFNYSKKSNFYEIDEIADELKIEGEKVLDYDTIHSSNQFESFARDYSSYIGEDKEIYFIIVNETDQQAYKFTNGIKSDLKTSLSVIGEEIQFLLDGEVYSFPLEEGENFHFILIYEKEGEKYVFSN